MNLLMMTLVYPQEQMEEVTRNAKDKLQNQINNYQRAFIEGISYHLQSHERLSILNSLPVGIFPLQYCKLFLRGGMKDGGTIRQISDINLPFFKQLGRQIAATRELRRWVESDSENRTVLLYTQYLPYVKAVERVKKKHPDLKAAVIVTDLPNELGLASGRKGFFKWIEQQMGNNSMALCRQLDGFVLLTKHMATALQVADKPYVVIEGLIQQKSGSRPDADSTQVRPTILYTGTLEPSLGIGDLLRAFEQTPECDLWICGQGSMQSEVEKSAEAYANIRYFGFVSQKEALALQAKATALINPRTPEGLFTKYSFPSKTLEYLRSGKPVLCYKLEGIPDDYDPYLVYIAENGAAGIQKAIRKLLALTEGERTALGTAGRNYVLTQKNPQMQCKRLMTLLRGL